MATYYYACKKCEKKLERKLKKEKRERTTEEYESLVLFEAEHSMNATDAEVAEAAVCPRCNAKGDDCYRTFYGYGNQVMYVRGNGYLDKEGVRRDMNLHKLVTDDPYKEMRVPGEVDDMKVKFKRAGQHNPNTKHMVIGKGEMEAAVRDSVNAPDPPASSPPAAS